MSKDSEYLNRAARRAQRRPQQTKTKITATLEKRDKPKIFVAFAHPGMVHTLFMMSMLEVVYSQKFGLQIVEAQSGPVISYARNLLTKHFLDQSEADYYLSLDTDMVFNSEVIEDLVAADKPIVSALYMGQYPGPDDVSAVAMDYHEDDRLFHPLVVEGEPPRHTLREVSGVGMGCCLIKREVLTTLGADTMAGWPYGEAAINGVHYGEDLNFCLRAAEAGFKSYVDLGARVGHRKTFTL